MNQDICQSGRYFLLAKAVLGSVKLQRQAAYGNHAAREHPPDSFHGFFPRLLFSFVSFSAWPAAAPLPPPTAPAIRVVDLEGGLWPKKE